NSNTSSNGRVWHSTDEGTSWTPVKEFTSYWGYPWSSPPSNSGSIATGKDGAIFVSAVCTYCDSGYVARSTDDGKTWQTVWYETYSYNGSGNFVYAPVLISDSSGNVYVNSGTDMYRTTDNGTTWDTLTNLKFPIGFPGFPNYPGLIAVDNSQNLYAVLSDSGIYRSTDHGDGWTYSPFAQQPMAMTQLCCSPDGDLYSAVRQGDNTLGGFIETIFRSTDHGSTWTPCDSSTSQNGYEALATSPNGSVFAADAQDGEIIRSTNAGTTWKVINNDSLQLQGKLPVCYVSSLALDGECFKYAGTYGFGAYRSLDSGRTWRQINNGLFCSTVLSISISPDGYLYAGTLQGLFISSDKGDTWIERDSNIPNVEYGNGDTSVLAFAFDSAGGVFATTLHGIFYSDDQGEHWQNRWYGAPVSCIQYGDSGRMYAGSCCNWILQSTDSGKSWITITMEDSAGRVSHPGIYVTGLIEHAGEILVASDTGLYRSTNLGVTWEAMKTSGLDTAGVWFLYKDTLGTVYAPMINGTFISSDMGATWKMDTGITYIDLYDWNQNFFRCVNAPIWVFTPPIDYSPIVTGIIPSPKQTPSLFTLSQNYPDPAVSSANIDYTLARSGYVSLKIYDALGREVTELVNGIESAGTHTAFWQPQGLPGGVYFYRLSLGNQKALQTRRLLLLK
ncbi:MAG TPA: T9SS type A sorting domain-containing protein, partial [Candidatus Kapabacteria bacterium]|nr:T9SS type A sorting domain-containing protein [Candidatus Kapabacteria bacterium]